MTRLTSWRKGVVIAAVLAGGFRLGVAAAQDATATGTAGTATVESQQTAALSGDQQLAEATRTINHISEARQAVSDLLDRARQSTDVIKVNCLDDKLTRIDVAASSASDHRSLLETSIATNNDGQRNHEYSLITIYGHTVDGISAEARQCIGEENSGFGEAPVRSYVPNPNVPTTDTTQYPTSQYTPEPLPPQTPVR